MYKTPQLLELSGIGRKSILSKYRIETLVDLPVGENYQDHLMVSLNFALTPDAQGEFLLLPLSVTALLILLNIIPVTSDAKPEPGKE
jgi:choline dehydrogenase-like flavoprotein